MWLRKFHFCWFLQRYMHVSWLRKFPFCWFLLPIKFQYKFDGIRWYDLCLLTEVSWLASGGHLGGIWETSGGIRRHLGCSWKASGKCMGSIWEAYGECHHGLAWIGCASTSCVHWHHIESNPVAEAPLARLVESLWVVFLHLHCTSHQSCDLSTLWIPAHICHLVQCLDSFTLA